jgi:hypothetical protein
MKIVREEEKFRPIVVTLESQSEVEALAAILADVRGLPSSLMRLYPALAGEKYSDDLSYYLKNEAGSIYLVEK